MSFMYSMTDVSETWHQHETTSIKRMSTEIRSHSYLYLQFCCMSQHIYGFGPHLRIPTKRRRFPKYSLKRPLFFSGTAKSEQFISTTSVVFSHTVSDILSYHLLHGPCRQLQSALLLIWTDVGVISKALTDLLICQSTDCFLAICNDNCDSTW